jgi:DNA-binding XRE family transcriptional regulator
VYSTGYGRKYRTICVHCFTNSKTRFAVLQTVNYTRSEIALFQQKGGAGVSANKVRHYRKKRGLTQSALAEQAGVTVGYISQVEKQKRTPSLAVAGRIAKALDLRIETVFPA